MAYIDDKKNPGTAGVLKGFYAKEVSDIYWDVDKKGYMSIISGKYGGGFIRTYFFDLEKIKADTEKLKERIAILEKEDKKKTDENEIVELTMDHTDHNKKRIINDMIYEECKDLLLYIQNIILYKKFCEQNFPQKVFTEDNMFIHNFRKLFHFFFEEGKSDGALYLENIGASEIKLNNRANTTEKKELLLFEVKLKNKEGQEFVKTNKFLYDSYISVLRPIYKIRDIAKIKENIISLENLEKMVIEYYNSLDESNKGNFERLFQCFNMSDVDLDNGKVFPSVPKNRDDLSVFFEGLNLGEGLMLISGPTGSGKTTLMMSLLNDYVNTKEKTIVTIEDPIEYYLHSQKSIIIQREIGKAVESYEKGLTDALRQRPSIITLGEVRNPETALQLANAIASGHLVIGTVHASSIAETIKRIENLLEKNNVKIFYNYVINLRSVQIKFGTGENEELRFASIYEHYLFDSSKDAKTNLSEVAELDELFLSINKKLVLLYSMGKISLDNCLALTSDKNKLLKDLKELSNTTYFRQVLHKDTSRVEGLTKGVE